MAAWLMKVLVTLALAGLTASASPQPPNIRIQVNNDNLKAAPYLLEAIRLAESEEHREQEAAAAAVTSTGLQSPEDVISDATGVSRRYQLAAASEPRPGAITVAGEDHELAHLDPDSVLKLSPESLINNMSPADYDRMTAPIPARAPLAPVASAGPGASGNLPVTNSHLKRPIQALVSDEPRRHGILLTPPATSGSHVSPSVAAEESPIREAMPVNVAEVAGAGAGSGPTFGLETSAAELEDRRREKRPTEVRERDQLDIENVRSPYSDSPPPPEPAIQATPTQQRPRTRITVGGGYARDRNHPPEAIRPPGKPLAPLERPRPPRPEEAAADEGPEEDSRVIEVPERVVLPASALHPVASPSKPAPAVARNSSMGSRDARCPKEGVAVFEHPSACDKFLMCQDGYMTTRTCPNGLMFGNHIETVTENCIHRWQADCSDKSIPNPISSPGCRWQYGLFNVQGSPKCTPDFYECIAGKFEVRKCSIEGQIYDDRTKSCKFAEQAGCAQEALSDFQCPPDDQANTYWPFPRYFLNERALIHCINDKPQIVRCTENERVDPEHLHCVPAAKLASKLHRPDTESRRARERKPGPQAPASMPANASSTRP